MNSTRHRRTSIRNEGPFVEGSSPSRRASSLPTTMSLLKKRRRPSFSIPLSPHGRLQVFYKSPSSRLRLFLLMFAFALLFSLTLIHTTWSLRTAVMAWVLHRTSTRTLRAPLPTIVFTWKQQNSGPLLSKDFYLSPLLVPIEPDFGDLEIL